MAGHTLWVWPLSGCRRLFPDGVTRPVYEDEDGQYVIEDGERIGGVWVVPEEDRADMPLVIPYREDR